MREAQGDIKLVGAFNNGEKWAYKKVYFRYYNSLCFFVCKLGLQKGNAEEVVQDVFVRIWKRENHFESLNAIGKFLYVSCRNGAFNFLKKEKSYQARKDDFSRLQDDSIEQPITHQIIYSETISRISWAIEKLPPQCGKVISLLFIEEMTPKEIADHLKISRNTVYNQKMRGIQLLKDILSEEDVLFLMLVAGFWSSL